MTDTSVAAPSTVPPTAPPYSRLVRQVTGVCLVVAALTNGLSQYVVHLVAGDLGDFTEQIRWGTEHLAVHRTEQALLVVSTLVMPLGLLGIAQVTRWSARRLTLLATPLTLWGMWGFHNVLAMGYLTGTAAPQIIGLDAATTLNEDLISEPGVVWLALVPHLVGSFFGVLLLMVAAWRSGAFPRAACALVVAFLVWDFLLAPLGPLEPHLLLAVGWGWLGLTLIRMPDSAWRGSPRATGASPAPTGTY